MLHENWLKSSFLKNIKNLALKRSLKSNTISPLLSISNKEINDHCEEILKIPGTQLLFGGNPIKEKNDIPSFYGSFEPTAIFVPFEHLLNEKYKYLLQKEIFGPF